MQPPLKSCHCCGLIQAVPDITSDQMLLCFRCRSKLTHRAGRVKSASRTAAAATGAFFLFWPAVLLPILKIEQLGMTHQSSILGGTLELFTHGSYFVGTVVMVFSIIFPLTKIVLLIELSLLEIFHRRHKAFTLRMMEHFGKWSMMDVMLLAFLVMLVKIGEMVQFSFGPAVFAFTLCVAMSMLASLSFDPHAIWED